MASFKQAFLFISLFVAISVYLSWDPSKMQVMALRDLPGDFEEIKGKLFQIDDITTCGHRCKGRSDCKEGFICSTCLKIGKVSYCV
ncbi:fruit-specific protein-like [Solanum pennellii]|uniref:Fruit-specific protein-like n=2 Tax=Solanum subgen. Lycopersicon TaxID=49274 RepID=A0ABM1GDG5_SOLPN|nr:fruit-specific protein-like [Solanum pennellii]TMW81031.1 hypothetical protein EJD97_012609 [Solanum chilense]